MATRATRMSAADESDRERGDGRTPFVGRDEELSAIDDHFAERTNLVTLTGPPGAGKTRLALEFACRRTPDSVEPILCDLATCEDEISFLSTVAESAGIPLQDGDAADELRRRVGRSFAQSDRQLVLLDNFEALVDAAADIVADWSEMAADTRFLVTSRRRLGLVGEYCIEVGPLEEREAVALFAERARMVRRSFSLDPDIEADVAELVDRLDRLPLALELAAARIRTLPPVEMLDRLNERFRVLRTDDRLEHRRDETLAEAIAWSWERLAADEREALAQTAVFRGGFSLEAAEAVLEVDGEGWTVDLLESLVRQSLLLSRQPDDFAGRVRFDLFESIRDFVLRETDEPDRTDLAERHAAFFLDYGTGWADELTGEEGREAMARLQAERANLYAALDHLEETDPRGAARLGLVLDGLLRVGGPVRTHVSVVDRAIAATRQTDDPALLAETLLARGNLAVVRGHLDRGEPFLRDALQAAQSAEEPVLEARARFSLGEIARNRGDLDEAADLFEETLRQARDAGATGVERLALAHLAGCRVDLGAVEASRRRLDQLEALPASQNLRREAQTMQRAAYVAYFHGDYEKQRRFGRRALEQSRRVADRKIEGLSQQTLGDSAFARGDYETAIDRYRQALQRHRELGNEHYEGMLLGNLGTALHRLGRLDPAVERYRDGLEIHRRTGARPYRATVALALVTLHFERGELTSAEERLAEALETFADIDNQQEEEAAVRWTLGWCALADADPGRAAERFDQARRQFAEVDSRDWALLSEAAASAARQEETPMADVAERLDALDEVDADCRALFGLVRAYRLRTTDPEAASQRIERAREGSGTRPPLFARSLYGRVAILTVERALERTAPDPVDPDPEPADTPSTDEADLVVGPDGRWFRRDGETADLRRRGSLRRILNELADRHGADDPAEAGLDVYDLFDIGWPDQEIDPDSAADRVYWAVRELRKAGLDGVLQTTDDGYLLAADVVVARAEESTPPTS